MALNFTRDNPPKSGKARKLWIWWTKINGEPPRELGVIRPGRWQSAAGSAYYVINNKFLIYSVPDALKQTMKDADLDRATGDYHFN